MRYVSRFLITLVGTAALSGCGNPAKDAFNASLVACAAKFPVVKGRTVAGAQCLHNVVFTQGPAAFFGLLAYLIFMPTTISAWRQPKPLMPIRFHQKITLRNSIMSGPT